MRRDLFVLLGLLTVPTLLAAVIVHRLQQDRPGLPPETRQEDEGRVLRLALERGGRAAAMDHQNGVYELHLYGVPEPWDDLLVRLMDERYGVRLRRVGFCQVRPEAVAYANGYNAMSSDLLDQKFGKDIYGECARDAEEAWGAANPRKEP